MERPSWSLSFSFLFFVVLQRAYYFPEAFLRALFEAAGFRCVAMKVHERTVENRARGLEMNRWGTILCESQVLY